MTDFLLYFATPVVVGFVVFYRLWCRERRLRLAAEARNAAKRTSTISTFPTRVNECTHPKASERVKDVKMFDGHHELIGHCGDCGATIIRRVDGGSHAGTAL
jgi:hypothetical protein